MKGQGPARNEAKEEVLSERGSRSSVEEEEKESEIPTEIHVEDTVDITLSYLFISL